MAFHEVQFPPHISYGVIGGPERRTFISESSSGYEARNQVWKNSRRVYNAGYGVKDLDDLYSVIEFFEERRGMFHGFRWKDWLDYKSCPPLQTPYYKDQVIGVGDGTTTQFQLVKVYGSAYDPWTRTITKPVEGKVYAGFGDFQGVEGVDWTVDTTTGVITFTTPPTSGEPVTAGFEFDTPVRFDTDSLQISITNFEQGQIPDIPIKETRDYA